MARTAESEARLLGLRQSESPVYIDTFSHRVEYFQINPARVGGRLCTLCQEEPPVVVTVTTFHNGVRRTAALCQRHLDAFVMQQLGF